jgi:hypothetical protein
MNLKKSPGMQYQQYQNQYQAKKFKQFLIIHSPVAYLGVVGGHLQQLPEHEESYLYIYIQWNLSSRI